MKAFLLILVLVNTIPPLCSAQKTFDTSYRISVVPSPPVNIPPTKYSDQQKRDSIYNKHAARSYEEHARAMETYLLGIENPGITRKETGVEVKLLNGKELKLTPRGVYEDFTFAHYFKNEKLVVFRVLEVMDWSYIIVNLRDGKSTGRLVGIPIFSPDRKMLISYHCDIESGELDNGFQLLSFTNGQVKELCESFSDSWGPTAVKWLDNTTLVSQNQQLDGPDIYKKIIIKRAVK